MVLETEMDDDTCVVADERNYVYQEQPQPTIKELKAYDLQSTNPNSSVQNSPVAACVVV